MNGGAVGRGALAAAWRVVLTFEFGLHHRLKSIDHEHHNMSSLRRSDYRGGEHPLIESRSFRDAVQTQMLSDQIADALPSISLKARSRPLQSRVSIIGPPKCQISLHLGTCR
jgi:hypothetical protein